MPYAELRSKLLEARDLRQGKIDEALAANGTTLLQSALNIPGEQKCPPGAESLIKWADEQLNEAFPDLHRLYLDSDALGPWLLYSVNEDPDVVKRVCCRIEQSRPFARLLDLDVFASSGRQIDRNSLNLDPRSCLVCREAAKDCMRTRRHERGEIDEHVQQLLESVPA